MIAGTAKERIKPFAQIVIRNTPGRRVRWGSLRRRQPFSECFGWDRGLPVDRFFIEQFLDENRTAIRGRAMEVRTPEYARRFGDQRVTDIEVIDIDAGNREATLVADLCEPRSLPVAAYDSIVCTQTLHYLPDEQTALLNLWNALAPGGTLLLTAPCITRVDNEAPDSDFWRYTPLGLERRLRQVLPESAEVQTRGYGNVFAAAAFLMGIAVEEFDEKMLAYDDPRFAQVSCAIVRKPSE